MERFGPEGASQSRLLAAAVTSMRINLPAVFYSGAPLTSVLQQHGHDLQRAINGSLVLRVDNRVVWTGRDDAFGSAYKASQCQLRQQLNLEGTDEIALAAYIPSRIELESDTSKVESVCQVVSDVLSANLAIAENLPENLLEGLEEALEEQPMTPVAKTNRYNKISYALTVLRCTTVTFKWFDLSDLGDILYEPNTFHREPYSCRAFNYLVPAIKQMLEGRDVRVTVHGSGEYVELRLERAYTFGQLLDDMLGTTTYHPGARVGLPARAIHAASVSPSPTPCDLPTHGEVGDFAALLREFVNRKTMLRPPQSGIEQVTWLLTTKTPPDDATKKDFDIFARYKGVKKALDRIGPDGTSYVMFAKTIQDVYRGCTGNEDDLDRAVRVVGSHIIRNRGLFQGALADGFTDAIQPRNVEAVVDPAW